MGWTFDFLEKSVFWKRINLHLIKATLSSPNFCLSSTRVFSPTSLLMSDRQTCHHHAHDDDDGDNDIDDDDGDSDDDEDAAEGKPVIVMLIMMTAT